MVSVATRFLTFAALAAVLYGAPADAQTGRITGVVRDARGVAVPGATVRVMNQGTGASSRTTTATDGSYAIPNLAPGAYTVSALLPGVRTVPQKDIQVAADAVVSIDFVLQPLMLEAITVTAMFREQELADVPFSIAAPSERLLRARGADNIEAIAANVAGFSVQNLGPGQSQVAMRGVSSGQIARDQPGVKEEVGAYLDDAAISLSLFTPDLDLFDVSRVEVLRGPQGTLFGAGSLAGTVRYISNQPQLGVSSTFGEVGGSWIDGGAPGSNAKLGFNVPMGDKAAFRVAAYSNLMGGYMDAVQPNLTVNKDVNSSNRTGVRAAFRFTPSERFSITPRVVYQRVKADGWNRIDAYNILANPFTTTRPKVTLGERQLFTQIAEPFTDNFLLGDLNLQYASGGVRLTSITSYTHRDVLVVRDAGALTSSITGSTPLTLPENVYSLDAPLNDSTNSKVWTQEVRLSGGTDRVKWLVGGFYSKNKRHYAQDLFVSGFDTLAAPILGAPNGFTKGQYSPKDHLFWSRLDYDLRQYAAFGEATLSVGTRIDLTGGLRYYNFDESREQIFDGIFGQDATGAAQSQPGAAKADGVVPRFIASYQVSDALTFNAQASKGFRLGGINDPLNVNLCSPQDLVTFGNRDSWKDETAWNYEVGAKSQVFGGRGSINVSAFYMDISDLQLTVTAGTCSSRLIFNVPKARSQGLDVEFAYSPSEHFDFSVSASLNNSELRSTVTSTDTNNVVSVVSGMEAGNRLPSVPQVQGTAAATYQWQLSQGSRPFVSGSYQYIGSRYTQIGDHAASFGTVNMNSGRATIGGPLTQSTFTFDPLLPAYSIFNLRAGLMRENWEVAVFINNLTDERAFLALDQERGTFGRVGYLTNQPRTGGITLRFNY
jgi:iron complex outermembrane receptor protein